ncbi:hypothetical protein D3C86_1212700 [compost metagenome]
MFKRGRNARKTGFQRAGGNGQEADHVGTYQRGHGPHQEQPRSAKYLGDRRVDPHERRQQPDRQHGAGHRIAQAGNARAGAAGVESRAFTQGAPGPRHDQTAKQRDDGGAERHDQRVAQAVDQLLGHAAHQMQPLVGFHDQVQGRRHKAQHNGDPAQHGGDGGGRPVQPACLHRAHALRVGIALPLAAVAFQQDQPDHDGQHRQRNLRRARQIGPRDPGGVDRHRQRLHPQEFRGANVVQGFQQRQADAHHDGGAGQGQGHPAEDGDAAGAQRARGFQQAGRLRHEHDARAQVNVGVQHEAQHEDGAVDRPQVRQAEIARAVVAQQGADGGLDGADGVQQVQVGKRNDVGGYRQRQQ